MLIIDCKVNSTIRILRKETNLFIQKGHHLGLTSTCSLSTTSRCCLWSERGAEPSWALRGPWPQEEAMLSCSEEPLAWPPSSCSPPWAELCRASLFLTCITIFEASITMARPAPGDCAICCRLRLAGSWASSCRSWSLRARSPTSSRSRSLLALRF